MSQTFSPSFSGLAFGPSTSLPCSSETLVSSTSSRPCTQGGPFSRAVGFQARIDDRAIGRGRADHRGEHEQAVLERGIEPAVLVADPGVVGVHEHV